MKGFDVSPIISNFYESIFFNEKRPNSEGYIILIFPCILAQLAVIRHLEPLFLTILGTALSVLFGFTFHSLLTVAKYTPKDDPVEEEVVRQTRIGTSYGLLVNFTALSTIVFVVILFPNLSGGGYITSTAVSALVYYLVFHYLVVMMYMMRHLFLLAVGGAFEESSNAPEQDVENEREMTIR